MMRAALAMTAAAVCTIASPAMAQVTHTVNQVGLTFSPASLTIDEGDTVEWVWASGVHTVTSGPASCVPDGAFNMPLDAGNPLASMTFNSAGTVDYFCSPHCGLGMTGTITVNPGPAVPTVSEWGMIAMGLLTLTGGTLIIRKATAARRVMA